MKVDLDGLVRNIKKAIKGTSAKKLRAAVDDMAKKLCEADAKARWAARRIAGQHKRISQLCETAVKLETDLSNVRDDRADQVRRGDALVKTMQHLRGQVASVESELQASRAHEKAMREMVKAEYWNGIENENARLASALNDSEKCLAMANAGWKAANDGWAKERAQWDVERKRLDDEAKRLRDALAFYADPMTYEQVDVLGKCGLSDDRNRDGEYGLLARLALSGATDPRRVTFTFDDRSLCAITPEQRADMEEVVIADNRGVRTILIPRAGIGGSGMEVRL